jgi:tetratricopeptide (TPR) repeat protein
MQMQYVRVVLAVGCVVTMLGCRSQVGTGDEASLQESEPRPYSASPRRVRMPSGTLGKDYRRAMKGSIEAAEQFIQDHPIERDFCAGALLHIASVQARQDKKKAIASYQRAIDEYGEELIPDKNASLTVADDASFKIARLECDMGNREKALAIYGRLMKSSDSNTRSRGRRKYLSLKQSHLKGKSEADQVALWEARVGKRITLEGDAVRGKDGVVRLRPTGDTYPHGIKLKKVLRDIRGGQWIAVRVTGTLQLDKHVWTKADVEKYHRDLADGRKQMQMRLHLKAGRVDRDFYISDAVVTRLATPPTKPVDVGKFSE